MRGYGNPGTQFGTPVDPNGRPIGLEAFHPAETALADANFDGKKIYDLGGLSVGYKTIKEIWIGVRTTNKTGSGSRDDPYDGSTRAKFDALMLAHGTAANKIIRLHDNEEYETYGYGAYGLAAGVRIVGNGPKSTILKMMQPLTNNLNTRVLYSLYDDLEVYDLGIDCNGVALVSAYGVTGVSIAALAARSGIFHNVHVLNPRSGTEECFVLGFDASGPVGANAAARYLSAPRRCEVSSCRVESPAGGAGMTAICANAGYFEQAVTPANDLLPYGRFAVLRDNSVDGGTPGTTPAYTFNIAYQVGGFRKALVTGNYSRNANFGFFQDTHATRSLDLTSNTFEGCGAGVLFNGGGRNMTKGGTIRGNHIFTYGAGIALNSANHMLVEDNWIWPVDGADVSAALIFQNKNAGAAYLGTLPDNTLNVYRNNHVHPDFVFAEVTEENDATGSPQLYHNRYFDGSLIASVPDNVFPSSNVAFDLETDVPGVYTGIVAGKPTLLLANGTPDQNIILEAQAGGWVLKINDISELSVNGDGQFSLTSAMGQLFINGTRVLAGQKPGWAAPTGTLARTTFATYTAPDISASPTEAEVQALADHVQILSRRLGALLTDVHADNGHGLIGPTP